MVTQKDSTTYYHKTHSSPHKLSNTHTHPYSITDIYGPHIHILTFLHIKRPWKLTDTHTHTSTIRHVTNTERWKNWKEGSIQCKSFKSTCEDTCFVSFLQNPHHHPLKEVPPFQKFQRNI